MWVKVEYGSGSEARRSGYLTRPDEGPVRLRRNGRQPKAVGLYFSVKAGRHLPYESTLELHDIWRAEVDPMVVRSQAQPFTVSCVQDGRLIRYTPDRLDHMASGARRVIEVKDQISAAEAVANFGAAADLLSMDGFSFEIRQRAQIDAQPSLGGVEAVQRHRRTHLTPGDAARLARVLEAGPLAFGEVADQMQVGVVGHALVCAGVVRRLARIDLADGLHPECLVERVA